MRILIYPHDLAVGGSQLNAVDLAGALQRRGHDVLVYGQPGPLTALLDERQVEFRASPPLSRRPSPAVSADLRGLVRDRRLDVLHGFEWPPGLECGLGARGTGALAVTTVMSMAVADFLPRSAPLTVGTAQIATAARRSGFRSVRLLEPPVDTSANRPGAVVPLALSGPARPTVVCVTRLADQLKLEGVLQLVDAVVRAQARVPLRLVLVGDGPARHVVAQRVAAAERVAGPGTVILTGELGDPRPAYAAADVAVGMGGSALRALAFGKPLVVQGERGFFATLDPATLERFRWTGWYGVGDGVDPVERLADQLVGLVKNPDRCLELAAFGRRVVEQHYDLDTAARRLEDLYGASAAQRAARRGPGPVRAAVEDAAVVTRFGAYHARKRIRRLRRRVATDDFNAKPVAAALEAPPGRLAAWAGWPAARAEMTRREQGWLWFPGVSYDAVPGTDRQLVSRLAADRTVLWVDPPMSVTSRRKRGVTTPLLSIPEPGVVRLSCVAPPGVTRPMVHGLTKALVQVAARAVVRRAGMALEAVVVSTPDQAVPLWVRPAARVYFETDDFLAGAGLLGLPAGRLRRSRRRNIERSDLVVAVSEPGLASLGGTGLVLPNGCEVGRGLQSTDAEGGPVDPSRPIAGVVGQLNERLDLGLLEAVADAGIGLLLLGPRHEQCAGMRARLDRLVARPEVCWVDRRPPEDVPAFLARIAVGLTPYTASEFNRGSAPLKTLEYLAAGLPVVSTDLPSARALESPDVALATGPDAFVSAVREAVLALPSDAAAQRRRDFAAGHSWERRAAELVAAVQETHMSGGVAT